MIKTADQRYSDWIKDGRTTTLDRDQLYEQFMRTEIRELRAALQSQAQQPTELSEQLREYAGNSGYSHNDYADTMLAAATEIERLASQAQQSQWMPIETAPTGKEFLLAFYYRHRPHDVLRRVVTFIDKDIIALGWSEIPPAPEGE